MTVRLGVVGCGSVFMLQYLPLIEHLRDQGRAKVTAVCDTNPEARAAAADKLGVDPGIAEYADLVARDDVDVVCVFTSAPWHAAIARVGLEAGKHVLVEKPMATTLAEADEVMAAASASRGTLVCAPHHLLSPTYRAVRRHVTDGDVGRVLSVRARYGSPAPQWGEWFYRRGGGALFDLGVYSITSLCGILGPARRVVAMTGILEPERIVGGRKITVEAEETAHVVIDFGNGVFASLVTGFTVERFRSPSLEIYGDAGTIQLLGYDSMSDGYELWRNEAGAWQIHPELDPAWRFTDGLRHLVECIETDVPTITRPEHAYHVLEVMLAAQASGADGRVREIRSGFPTPAYEG